jgi:hypothetical protein
MIITKKVYQTLTAEQSKSGVETETSYDMFYKIGCGWVASRFAASVLKTDESVAKWVDVAFRTMKDNEFLNVID